MDDQEVKFCSNCKHEVPAANFMMHHIHCQRKLALCQKCDEPIPHSEFAVHNLNLHASISCQDCGQQMEKMLLSEHKRSLCSHRTVCCTFCHIEVEAIELMDHENYCGSRTERCDECGEFVMLKYQQLHKDSNHGFLKLDDEAGPTPLWSASRATPSVLNDLSRQRKVSNASQDTTRPTSALNRLSPSKRTNDMPQVNSASTVSKPKAFNKTTISQGSTYEEDSVDLDLLLALRLEEEEKSRVTAPSAPPARDFHETEDLVGELVALPCEFCEAMIPANQLVIHETGCRPDLAQYNASPTPRSKSKPHVVEDGLPCEFCGDLFAPQHLLQHETACEVASALQESIRINKLGILQPSRITKKIVNMEPRRLSANHDTGDKSSYLTEVRAALTKPTANVTPLTGPQSPVVDGAGGSGSSNDGPYVNGYARHPGSTGAVRKQQQQKAGRQSSMREVSKEVSRTASPSVTTTAHRPGLDSSNSSR